MRILKVAAIAGGRRERRPWRIAAGAIGIALKPHIAIGVAAAVAVTLVAGGAWRTSGSIAATVTIVVGLALLRSPDAIGAILSRGGAKAGIAWSTTFAFADATRAPVLTLAVVGLVALGASAAAIRSVGADRRDLTIVAGAAALSVLAAPQAHPDDFPFARPAFPAPAAPPPGPRPPPRAAPPSALPRRRV